MQQVGISYVKKYLSQVILSRRNNELLHINSTSKRLDQVLQKEDRQRANTHLKMGLLKLIYGEILNQNNSCLGFAGTDWKDV